MIVVAGFSHHTAPIAIREKFALDEIRESGVIEQLLTDPRVGEAFAVSTCNRVEIYAAPKDPSGESLALVERACSEILIKEAPVLEGHLYSRSGLDAVRHLVRVASSLDSLVVGEAQILGQLKQGFERGVVRGSVGAQLHRAFAKAVRGAKRVRSETNIGAGQVSVPSIAIDLAGQIFGDIRGHRAVLIGSGEMGQTVGRLLVDLGARLTIVGRNLERLAPLAEPLRAQIALLEQLPEVLIDADIVVSSTSAPEPVVTSSTMSAIRKARKGRSLFFIDLAVPRDIEPNVAKFDGVFLYNIDDLSAVARESRAVRQREADKASAIVEEVIGEFERWMGAEQVTPTIKALRARFHDVLQGELSRSLRGKLRDLTVDEQKAIDKMLDAGINRLLHAPTIRLREEAARSDSSDLNEWTRALWELFELEVTAVSAPHHEVPAPPGDSEISEDEELVAPLLRLEGRQAGRDS